jgi:hypothetical protein
VVTPHQGFLEDSGRVIWTREQQYKRSARWYRPMDTEGAKKAYSLMGVRGMGAAVCGASSWAEPYS